MVAPLIPIIVGGAMMAGGGASVSKGMRIPGLKPRGESYGGSAGALQGYREQYAGGIGGAQNQLQAGTDGLASLGAWGQGEAMNRAHEIDAALGQGQQAREMERQQIRALGSSAAGYVPGAQSEAAAKLAVARSAAANIGMARSGTNSAMGLRQALNANAQAGVDTAGQVAAIRAAEEQAAVQLRMEAAARAAQAANAMRGGDMGVAGLATGRQQFGVQTQGSAYGAIAQLGAGREATYLDQQQALEQAQLEAQLDYERRRQAEAQRKSSALINLGAGLIGAGGQVASMSSGGYGGGGGGGGGGGKPAGKAA